jgi:hypothetical protein
MGNKLPGTRIWGTSCLEQRPGEQVVWNKDLGNKLPGTRTWGTSCLDNDPAQRWLMEGTHDLVLQWCRVAQAVLLFGRLLSRSNEEERTV